MLIKFLRDEHVESFLCGNLYFKNAGYFIDLESKLFEKGIGDKYEGSIFQPINDDNPICTFDKNGITHPLNFTEAFSTQRYDISRQFQLTCFTDIVIEDLEPEGDEVKIKSEVLSELEKEFSKRVPIIIIDETQFFNKVSSAFKEMNIIAYRGHIKYFDEYTEATLNPFKYEHDIAEAFFIKETYSNIKESIG